MKKITLLSAILLLSNLLCEAQVNVGVDNSFGVASFKFDDKSNKLVFQNSRNFFLELHTKNPAYRLKLGYLKDVVKYNASLNGIENSYSINKGGFLIGLSNLGKIERNIILSADLNAGITWFNKNSRFVRNSQEVKINQDLYFTGTFSLKALFKLIQNGYVGFGLNTNYTTRLSSDNFIKNINGTGFAISALYQIRKKKNEKKTFIGY